MCFCLFSGGLGEGRGAASVRLICQFVRLDNCPAINKISSNLRENSRMPTAICGPNVLNVLIVLKRPKERQWRQMPSAASSVQKHIFSPSVNVIVYPGVSWARIYSARIFMCLYDCGVCAKREAKDTGDRLQDI